MPRQLLVSIISALLVQSFLFSQTTSAQIVSDNVGDREATLHAHSANGDYEPEVLSVIELLQVGQLDSALEKIEDHLARFPQSQVGHLLKADILSALTGDLSEVGGQSQLPKNSLDGLKHQLRNRWEHASEQQLITHERLPSSLLTMGNHEYVVVADMPLGRLYLYENNNGEPRLVRDYYMSVGAAGYGKQIEGDNKTPIGVYQINRYIEGRALPDLYGKGAFPVNYPNRYDRYLKRTGYGIWLHGTPSDSYARSPWASEGCFVLSNDDLLDIGQYLSADKRTPVILSDEIEWLSRQQLKQRREQYLALVSQWKDDWESLNTQAYIAHYQADDFNLGKGSYKSWAARKKSVNEAKSFVQVDLEVESLFEYPGEKDMFVVTFTQRYISNDFSGQSVKEQIWKRGQQGQWQIIYEG